MAIVEMTQRDYAHGGFTYSEAISDGENGDTLRIVPYMSHLRITCTLIAGSNTGKFQITTSSDSAVTAGTATWQDWALGNKTGTVSDVLSGPVTGIRGVSVSGSVSIEVVVR